MMIDKVIKVDVKDNELIKQIDVYLQNEETIKSAWNEFMSLYENAYAIAPNYNGLLFNGKSPDGWTKAEGKDGFARPRTDSLDHEVFSMLPKQQKTWSLFKDDSIQYEIQYFDQGKFQICLVSNLIDGPVVGKDDNNYYVIIPDIKSAATHLKEQNYDVDEKYFNIEHNF